MTVTLTDIIAIVTLLLGSGGFVALYRARNQNKTDMITAVNDAVTKEREQLATSMAKEREQLAIAQSKFREDLTAEVVALRTRSDTQDKQIDTLQTLNSELGQKLARQEGLDERNREQLDALTKTNQLQATQITELSTRVGVLEGEKVSLIQQAQVATSKATFLERENETLRRENQRLKGLLPKRVEVPDETEEKRADVVVTPPSGVDPTAGRS